MRLWVLLLIAFASGSAAADEGEFFVGTALAADAVSVRHPLSASNGLELPNAAVIGMPHLTLAGSFGLSHELALHLGVGARAGAGVVTKRVAIGNATANLVTGTYIDATVPLGLQWILDAGDDFTAGASVDVGPSVVTWLGTVPLVAGESDRRFPLAVADATVLGGEARFAIEFHYRIGDWLFALYPEVGIGWAGTTSEFVGVGASVSSVLELVPP